MLGTFGKSHAQLAEALERIRQWTRERFALDADAVLLVTQVACAVPGCPPLETVVAFWTEGNRRHHFKVFKAAAQVEPADLPYAWMKDGLVVPDGFACDCC
ncbi:MAG: nitrate reductase molybdenum cofactor assembly chaperone [Ramlibacter sp.]|nr:nitrate reductase molybdenum cofactor assembly chaperone [Ramlibacter sp.]